MKLISAIGYFLALSNAISPRNKRSQSLTDLGEVRSSRNVEYCEKASEFFSEAKRNHNLSINSGHLTIFVTNKDLNLVTEVHDLSIFRNSAFSYILAKWHSAKSPEANSLTKVTLKVKNEAKSPRYNTHNYKIDLEPKTEPYFKAGKYHVLIDEATRCNFAILITLIALEAKYDDRIDDILKLCRNEYVFGDDKNDKHKTDKETKTNTKTEKEVNDEIENDKKVDDFCKVIEKAKNLNEVERQLIYNPTKDIVNTWSQCF